MQNDRLRRRRICSPNGQDGRRLGHTKRASTGLGTPTGRGTISQSPSGAAAAVVAGGGVVVPISSTTVMLVSYVAVAVAVPLTATTIAAEGGSTTESQPRSPCGEA